MRLLADLHTHTVASGHAFSTLTENAHVARARGLELIAITDHAPSVPQGAHAWYFWNLKIIPSVLDGVRLLKGCEANLSPDSENGLDLPDLILGWLDFVAVGFHPHTGCDKPDRVAQHRGAPARHGAPARRPDHAPRQRGGVPARPRRHRRGGGPPQRHPRAQRPQLRPHQLARGLRHARAPVRRGRLRRRCARLDRLGRALRALRRPLRDRRRNRRGDRPDRGAHRQPRTPSRCSRTCSASASGRGSTSAACGSGRRLRTAQRRPTSDDATKRGRGAGGSAARPQEPPRARLRAHDRRRADDGVRARRVPHPQQACGRRRRGSGDRHLLRGADPLGRHDSRGRSDARHERDPAARRVAIPGPALRRQDALRRSQPLDSRRRARTVHPASRRPATCCSRRCGAVRSRDWEWASSSRAAATPAAPTSSPNCSRAASRSAWAS